MSTLYPEYFNDVFGPIMQPGSSSHMAGPCRAGYLCNSLLNEPVKNILVEMDPDSSFSGAFGIMNEDFGMIAGSLGHLIDYIDFFKVKDYCKENNISCDFNFCPMKESTHLNGMKFILTGETGKEVTLVADSIGGGMVETVKVNGYQLRVKGDTYVITVFDKKNKLVANSLNNGIEGKFNVIESGFSTSDGQGVMYWYKVADEPCREAITELIDGVEFEILKPVLPVISRKDKKPQLFDTMTEWIRLAKEQGKSLYDVALDYEITASGWTKDQIVDYMDSVVRKAMHRKVHAFYDEGLETIDEDFTQPEYSIEWKEFAKDRKLFVGSTIGKTYYYLHGARPNIPGVACVPGPHGTGGGYLYCALSAVQEEHGFSHDDLIRGLFIAAGVGAICYTRTAPTGEVIGCTGECGVMSAMTSAAIAEMAGATPEKVETAASLALQATVGMPCDPIPGGYGIPCLSRTFSALTTAISFAEIAMSGVNAVLPFHEVVDVADDVCRRMSPDLLCTSKGGHCAAPTAKECARKFAEWRSKQ